MITRRCNEKAFDFGANPTTGYDWEVSLDEAMLEMGEMTYKLAEEAEHEIVGAGGVDYFQFKALKAGEAEITMVYKPTVGRRGYSPEGIYR